MNKPLLMLFLSLILFSCKKQEENYVHFDTNDSLIRPSDYRSWIFAGTATTPSDQNSDMIAFTDFQNIYIDPVSFAFWKENGYFREGTILVKEIIAAIDETNISIGKTYLQGKVLRTSALVKDSIRFPDVPGGWEYFTFTNEDGTYKKKSEPVGLKKGCIQCHMLTEAGSGPFAEHHAPLRDAKKFGKGSPENLDDRSVLPSENLKLLRDLKLNNPH